ncbi:MAG: hypothetical protein AAGF20_09500 [Pseudomonadota bacterium]
MAYVVKSDPLLLRPTRVPSVEFTSKCFNGCQLEAGRPVAWFTSEVAGGHGLYAFGKIVTVFESEQSIETVTFEAEFDQFDPIPLANDSFAELDRDRSETPAEKLNQCLYKHAHNKVAQIDAETADFLAQRFKG